MLKRNRTKVYKLNTIDNTVICEYSSMNECSFNEDTGYRTIWNQCNGTCTGNGGYINTPYYFSKYKEGITHHIIITENLETGEKTKYYNVSSAELGTGLSRNTIARHISNKHVSSNHCGIKCNKELVHGII